MRRFIRFLLIMGVIASLVFASTAALNDHIAASVILALMAICLSNTVWLIDLSTSVNRHRIKHADKRGRRL